MLNDKPSNFFLPLGDSPRPDSDGSTARLAGMTPPQETHTSFHVIWARPENAKSTKDNTHPPGVMGSLSKTKANAAREDAHFSKQVVFQQRGDMKSKWTASAKEQFETPKLPGYFEVVDAQSGLLNDTNFTPDAGKINRAPIQENLQTPQLDAELTPALGSRPDFKMSGLSGAGTSQIWAAVNEPGSNIDFVNGSDVAPTEGANRLSSDDGKTLAVPRQSDPSILTVTDQVAPDTPQIRVTDKVSAIDVPDATVFETELYLQENQSQAGAKTEIGRCDKTDAPVEVAKHPDHEAQVSVKRGAANFEGANSDAVSKPATHAFNISSNTRGDESPKSEPVSNLLPDSTPEKPVSSGIRGGTTPAGSTPERAILPSAFDAYSGKTRSPESQAMSDAVGQENKVDPDTKETSRNPWAPDKLHSNLADKPVSITPEFSQNASAARHIQIAEIGSATGFQTAQIKVSPDNSDAAAHSPKLNPHTSTSSSREIEMRPGRDRQIDHAAPIDSRGDFATADASENLGTSAPVVSSLSDSGDLNNALQSTVSTAEIRATEAQAIRSEPAISRAQMPVHIAQQLADIATRMPDRPVELTLNPEELGRVRMTLASSETGISVVVAAERIDTLDLMRRHIDILEQEFRQLGYSNISFDFSRGSTRDGQKHESPDSQQKEDLRHLAPEEDISPIRLNLGASEGLDLRL